MIPTEKDKNWPGGGGGQTKIPIINEILFKQKSYKRIPLSN